jgi:hypothetical protein
LYHSTPGSRIRRKKKGIPMSMADVLVDEAFEANVLLTVAWGGGS